MSLERTQYPYLAPTPCPPPGWTFNRADEEELEEYNKELHKYFARHERYLRGHIETKNWQDRTRSLWLTVRNEGKVPAEDIDISLQFPEGIVVISDTDFKALPTEPVPPDLPGQKSEPAYPEYESIMVHEEPTSIQNSTIIDISESRAQIVRLHVGRLKHTFSEDLPLLDVHFSSASKLKSFQFRYTIVAANFPEAIDGILNVKVTLRD